MSSKNTATESPLEKETFNIEQVRADFPTHRAGETEQEQSAQSLGTHTPPAEHGYFPLIEAAEILEQSRATGSTANQELAVTIETTLASPPLVNEANPNLAQTPTTDLDLMLNKAKTFSESYSRSISECSEPLTPSTPFELSEEIRDELKSFFRMLELPLSELATDQYPAFTSCVNHLISEKVLPLSEQIKLEEFGSSLSEILTIAAYYQKEIKEKYDTINQFATASKKLDIMGSNIHQLKNELQQIDKEEAELFACLNQLKEQRKTLLAQKELINHELASITYDEQGIKTIITVAKADLLNHQERYNVVNNRWSYVPKLFMDLKSKIH